MKLINHPDIVTQVLQYLPSEYILILYNNFETIKQCLFMSNYLIRAKLHIDLSYDYKDFPIDQFVFVSHRPYDEKYVSKLSRKDIDNLNYLFENAITIYIINYMYYYADNTSAYVRHVIDSTNVKALDKFTYIDPNYSFEYGLFDYRYKPDKYHTSSLIGDRDKYFLEAYDELESDYSIMENDDETESDYSNECDSETESSYSDNYSVEYNDVKSVEYGSDIDIDGYSNIKSIEYNNEYNNEYSDVKSVEYNNEYSDMKSNNYNNMKSIEYNDNYIDMKNDKHLIENYDDAENVYHYIHDNNIINNNTQNNNTYNVRTDNKGIIFRKRKSCITEQNNINKHYRESYKRNNYDIYEVKEHLLGRRYKITKYRTSQLFTTENTEIIEPPLDMYFSHDAQIFEHDFLNTSIKNHIEYDTFAHKFTDKLSHSPHDSNCSLYLIGECDVTIKNTQINNITLIMCYNITIESNVRNIVVMNRCKNITFKQKYISKVCLYDNIENSKFNNIGQFEAHCIDYVKECVFGNIGIYKGDNINHNCYGIIDTAIIQNGNPTTSIKCSYKVRKLMAVLINVKSVVISECPILEYADIYFYNYSNDKYNVRVNNCNVLKRMCIHVDSGKVIYDVSECKSLERVDTIE